MAPWANCSLEEEILLIAGAEAHVSVRYLCLLIYPWMSWQVAEEQTAEAVRQHCEFLVRQRCLAQIGADTYSLVKAGRT